MLFSGPLCSLPAMRPQAPPTLEHLCPRRPRGGGPYAGSGVQAAGAPHCSVAGGRGFVGPGPAWEGFLVCCPQHRSALSLPGPAGPRPVADADPAVPVRQLPAAPAGEQLCVHPHAAGRPLGDKDTVSFRRARAPACSALLSRGPCLGSSALQRASRCCTPPDLRPVLWFVLWDLHLRPSGWWWG